MKILIIRFSSIGDIVLATPVFRCVKKQLPEAEVHFLTKKKMESVTASNPYIDQFWYFDENLDLLLVELKKQDFDYVIDLHQSIRSIAIKKSLRKKTYTIRKLNFQKFVLTKGKINIMPGVHITTRSLQTVAPLGVHDDGGGLDYFIPEQDRVSDDDLPFSHIAGYIALIIGANHFTKRMPLHKLKELCLKLDYPIILIGGKEEIETGKELAAMDDVKIYNACGKFNLNESADIVRKSKVVISHDTGLLYIACAFQKPAVVIWGGTSPKLDVEPYYGQQFMSKQYKPFYYNMVLNLWCQPCSKYGLPYCPLGHFNCMEKQDINLIVQHAMELLNR